MVSNKKATTKARSRKQKNDIRLSKANYEFDVYSETWQLDANKSLNFKLLRSLGLTNRFEESFRKALADYASEFSSSYTDNLFRYCRWLLENGVTEKITEADIVNYKATLNAETEYKLGYIRAFLLDWHDKGIPGVEKKAVALLESLTLSGNRKGKAVAIGCPHSGAYTFEEQTDFISWYVDAYTEKLISILDYALIMALQQTGARPIQLASLYYGDIVIREELGVTHFDLLLPKAKKRDEVFRGAMQTYTDVGEDLILVLTAQAKRSVEIIERHFKVVLTEEQKKEIPIFLHEQSLFEVSSFREFKKRQEITPDLFCLRQKGASPSVEATIRHIAKECPLKTKRIKVNGEFGDLHINPRRFRYTHATNMAMLGASDYTIAEELGHSDTQQVKVYTEFNEDMADRIDEALTSDLTPLAQAFSGRLIDTEKDAVRANDPRSRINNGNGEPVGNCGKFGFCANGTIHCYTCNKFQPWVNGPHKIVLKTVIKEVVKKRRMGASEFVLQGHNRTVSAIKVVIEKCEARKQELEKEEALNV